VAKQPQRKIKGKQIASKKMDKNTASASKPQNSKTPSLKPLPIIDRSFKNDRSVELRGRVDLNATVVAQLQRAMLLQNQAKNGEKSSLKLYLGYSEANKYKFQDQAALADAVTLIATPVDVIVTAAIGPDVLKAFLSATGKRYMLAGASIYLGVIKNTAPYGKNNASQVRRNLFNDYHADLQTLLMQITGETDRVKVYRDLLRAKSYSSLEALAYGKQGLVDGVLMGPDAVITRQDLNAFLKGKRWTADEQAEFLRHYINIYQLPTRPLSSVSKLTIPVGTLSFYDPLKKPEKADKGEKSASGTDEKNTDDKATRADDKKASQKALPEEPVFYFGEKKLDKLPLRLKASKEKAAKRLFVEHLSTAANGILDDDVIFFNDGFNDETAEQIADALVALDHKKVAAKSKSHIKILENSPGGSVWSGQELRSLIKTLHTPVDVIVYGMGASCGSWLLCSATGNRLATPNARIMIHEAATQITSQTPHDHFNETLDGLHQSTLDYIAIVADACGRPFADVLEDFNHDVWFNPVECLFYGTNGMLDGILVSHNTVITKREVAQYLESQLGSKAKVAAYIKAKLNAKRDPQLGMTWQPEHHDEADPFENPLKVIAAVAKQAKPLESSRQFKGSAAHAAKDRTIDYFNVVVDDDK